MSTTLHWKPVESEIRDTNLQGNLADAIANKRCIGRNDIPWLRGALAAVNYPCPALKELIDAVEQYEFIEVFRR